MVKLKSTKTYKKIRLVNTRGEQRGERYRSCSPYARRVERTGKNLRSITGKLFTAQVVQYTKFKFTGTYIT